jgi:hypothetical protein
LEATTPLSTTTALHDINIAENIECPTFQNPAKDKWHRSALIAQLFNISCDKETRKFDICIL